MHPHDSLLPLHCPPLSSVCPPPIYISEIAAICVRRIKHTPRETTLSAIAFKLKVYERREFKEGTWQQVEGDLKN